MADRARATLLAAVLALAAACGSGGGDAVDPLALPEPDADDPCARAFIRGHNDEAAGTPTPEAFRASIEECESLARWRTTALSVGIDLRGREAQFVDNTCRAIGVDFEALEICKQAAEAVADPRAIP